MAIEQYADEKLSEAVYMLCTNPENIKERIKRAFDRQLIEVKSNDFTKDDLKDWNWIVKKVKGKGAILDNAGKVSISAVDNTLRTTSEEICVDIAKKLYALSCKYD